MSQLAVRSCSWLLGLAQMLSIGCAASVPAGRELPGRLAARQDLVLSGNPYELHHTGALRAASPAGMLGAGGRIEGKACGTPVDLAVQHRGDYIALEGSVGIRNAEITVEDKGGWWRISGYMGSKNFDLRLNQGGLAGRLGTLVVNMQAAGDALAGTIGSEGEERFAVAGLNELWRMPAADQGAVVPLMLACAEAQQERGQPLAQARFGGPPAELAGKPLSLGSPVQPGEW